jgi:hypothetical protein
MAAIPLISTLAASLIVLRRDSLERRHRPDLFYRYFNRDPSGRFANWRRWLRPWLGGSLRPGDIVRLREPAEVLATLDSLGRWNGLPFMPEMLACMGREWVVDRRIDKINDWMGGNELRRTRGIVTLVGARCGGEAHGGCQAGCHMLWSDQWLRRVERRGVIESEPVVAGPVNDALGARVGATAESVQRDGRTTTRFTCQITELVRASEPMSRWDIRQDLRPLLHGNLALGGFLVALLTTFFNWIQALRRGVEFPVTAPQLERGPTPTSALGLQAGELVQVRDKFEIGMTLHKNHNRGMWFGKETLRFCNQQYRVRGRVERIIHERSGELIRLNTPGVILEGVCGSGEFLRFCPQNEYVFWREIWLCRLEER